MRFFLLFFTLQISVLQLAAQDLSQYAKKTFISSRGDSLPYRILYPLNYDAGKSYPLILVLHGAGERGNDNEKQLVHGGKLFLADSNRTRYPAIVIFPQCPTNGYWSKASVNRNVTPYEIVFDYSAEIGGSLNAAMELVRQLRDTRVADKKKIFITGLSMGGMGTFEAVYRDPQLFAAAAPICGGGAATAYTKNTVKIPFRVFHGADDKVVSVDLSRTMVSRINELTGRVQYIEYGGVQHNSWDNAFAEPDFIAWFFQQKK